MTTTRNLRLTINADVHWSPDLDVQVAFDIGRGDNTVAWFWQETSRGIQWIDYYTNNGEQAKHYIDVLKGKPYRYSKIHLPHDAKAETFATHKSALEQFMDAFQDTDTQVALVPKLSIEDGIEAARQILEYSHFDSDRCYYGIECLRVYRKKWDPIHKCFMKTPLHDYASDTADSFRYAAIMANKHYKKTPTPHESVMNAVARTNQHTIEQLFTAHENSLNRHGYKSRRL